MVQTRRSVKAIDVHAHLHRVNVETVQKKYKDYVPHVIRDSAGREFLEVKGRPSTRISEQYGSIYNIDKRIQDMDDTSIDIQVISVPPMFMSGYDSETRLGVAMAQNDGVAEVVKAYPDRFVGLATVPLQDPLSAADEMERGIKQLGLRGVEIGTSVSGKNLDAPEL